MENEEQKLEQEAVVEEQETEETTPLVRNSRNRDESKILAKYDVNGVSVRNSHAIQSQNGAENENENEELKMEECDWVLENESEAINGEQKIEESDSVLENGAEAINGEKNSKENLVFHDKLEGIWKCRICTWTYGNGSVCVDHIQSQLHNLINIKTLNFVSEGLGVNPISTYICKTLIVEGPARTKYDVSSLDPVIQFNGTSLTNNQYEEEIEENGSNVQPSDSSSQEGVNSTSAYIIREPIRKGPVNVASSLDPAIEFDGASVISNQYEGEIEKNGISESSSQEVRNSHEPSSKEIESAETELINEDDLEITELDVERVIQKQTTHDLFCPNCKSCITKRVILSKRKRRIRITDEEVKRPKTGTATVGTVPPKDQVYQEGEVGNDNAQIPEIDEDERDRGPAIFRCLSCFSIFIPTGDGFKLFRSFGGKKGEDNVRDGQAPDIKKNWLSNIFFKPNRQKTPVEEGSGPQTNAQQVSSAIPSSDPTRESGRPVVLQDNGSPARAPERLEGTTGKTAIHEGRDLTLPDLYNLKLPLLVDATKADVLTVDQQMEPKPSQEVRTSLDKDVVQLPTSSVSTVEDADGTLNISVSIPHDEQDVRATIVTTSIVDSRNVDSRSSDNGEVYPAEVPQQMTTTTTFDFSHDKPLRTGITSEIGDAPAALGNDTRITIDTHPPALPGIIPLTVPQSEMQTSTADREGSGAREERKVEVIKSIVYGGLAETMTSLSVVSSAAGGGAATLNVLTLGAANLIGGLFIIAHNLWDLRCDRVEEQLSSQITEQADRYRELLGRRQNFALHAVVAIMSYIIFGLVPPVVYGFSFRESDDKQLKLLMVAAASLVCILVLTVGKVYVQRPPKSYFKTVMTFLILGISVSGVSYAAGGLVERLLEKLGLFEPSSAAPNLLVPEMRPVGSGWASY